MNENFFDTKEFLELCKANRIEPMITGENQLVLMCPKYPGKDIEDKFRTLIPEEVPWGFVEGLSHTTMAHIKRGLSTIGIKRVIIQNLPGHRVTIDITPPENHPLAQANSPIWDVLSGILKKDSYVETFSIRVNGQEIRNSNQYVGSSDPHPIDDEGDYQPDTYKLLPERQSTRTPTAPVSVKDDRFAYDRPCLPPDVATDVKILLESTGSVEEFLKNI